MHITPIRTDIVYPPSDDLLEKVLHSSLAPQEHDVIAITSKVVSIWQGRCVAVSDVKNKDNLIKKESDYYLERSHVPGEHVLHTIKENYLIPSAGIDRSNADDHYILWPTDPKGAAEELLKWLEITYGIERLKVIITDSHSVPLRRGVLGCAIGWAGFDPLYDYRGEQDLFGYEMQVSQINIPDALAAAAVLVMGEGNECTPLALIRSAPHVSENRSRRSDISFEVPLEEDLFAPFLTKVPWVRIKK